jgi:hypothetical protein
MADGADYCKPNTAATSTCRQREYLAEKEIERLIEAARKRGRNAPHDAAAIPLARIGTAACARALLRREDAVCAIRVPDVRMQAVRPYGYSGGTARQHTAFD